MDFFGILFDMKNGSKVPYSKSYFDTLFAAKLAEMQIKTITGVLPLTFTAKGGTAVDWTIYGNTQGVGENTEITGELPIDFRSNGDDLLGYKIYGTADEAGVQTENLVDVSASTLVPINTTDYRFGVSLGKLDAGNYVLSFVNNSAYTLYITKRTGTSYTQSSAILTSPFTFSVGDNVDEVYLRTTRTQAGSPSMWAEMGFTDIIINAGSTAPITYIPYGYQIPITISQTGQTVKTVNIYIGDSKLGEAEYVDYGEQKIYKRILFMTYDDKHFITKDNKDFCLRRRGYSG